MAELIERMCDACDGTGSDPVPSCWSHWMPPPCRTCHGNAYLMVEVGPDDEVDRD